jgi:Ion channel
MDAAGSSSGAQKPRPRLRRFHATHSYWAVLVTIVAGFLFAGLAPDADWATSVLVLIETGTLVLALRTSGWSVTQSRVVLVLVVVGVSAAAANLLWEGNALAALLNSLTGLLTLAIVVVVALGALEQGEVNSRSVAAGICVYVLLGLVFAYLYGLMAVIGHGPFFAQGTDGTRALRVYFSYVTLATIGYGDYTPAGNLGHTFAVLEALIGQLFLVTVVAVVVTRVRPIRRG